MNSAAFAAIHPPRAYPSQAFKDSRRFPEGRRSSLYSVNSIKIGATARNVGLTVVGIAATLGLAAGFAGLAHAAASTHAQTSAGRRYGNPAEAAPYWREQSLDDCALMATADVIGQLTKREVSEREIVAVAQRLRSRSHPGPVYTLPADASDPNRTGHGTEPQDLPVVMATYGIAAALTSGDADTPMETLEHYLAGGHKVIVGVNAELIWGVPIVNKDHSGDPTADHAVVVTGIDITDVANGKVHLNDSGSARGRDETVPLEVFAKSWATSNDEMVVTRETG